MMKKLIVIREGMIPDARELDDYVHDAEIVKGGYIDLTPEEHHPYTLDTLSILDVSYEIVFKDDNLYDYWHIAADTHSPYAFDTMVYKASVALLEPYREYLILTAMIHKSDSSLLIYRLPKAISHLIKLHLPFILKSFKEGTYHYAIPEDDIRSVHAQVQKDAVL